MRIAFAAFAILALAACGGSDSPRENTAEQLREAAEQSTPAAANVLENGAARIEDANGNAAAMAQNVLERAGNAQAANMQGGNAQGR